MPVRKSENDGGREEKYGDEIQGVKQFSDSCGRHSEDFFSDHRSPASTSPNPSMKKGPDFSEPCFGAVTGTRTCDLILIWDAL